MFILPFASHANTSTAPTKKLDYKKHVRDSLMDSYTQLGDDKHDEAISNLHRALELNEHFNDDTSKAYCVYALAWLHRQKGNIRLAIKYQEIALQTYEKLNMPAGVVSTANELGILYKHLGEYETTVKYYLKAIKIAEEINNRHIEELYHNLASVYNIMGNPDLSIKFLKINLESKKDSALHFNNYINLGIAYATKGNDSLAMVYYQKALDNCETYNRPQSDVNNVMLYIPEILVRLGQYKSALSCLMDIKDYEEKCGRRSDLALTYLNISKVYRKLNDYKKAILYARHTILIATETESNPQLLNGYLLLAELLSDESHHEESTNLLKLHIHLKDSLFNIKKNKYTEDLLAQFEAERKENEIVLLKKEQTLQHEKLRLKKQELKNQRLVRNIAFLIAFILLIIAIVLVLFYQNKARDNHMIALEKEENNKRQILDLIKNHEINSIKSYLNGQEKERKRIASELHDGIGGNLASIKLQLAKLDNEKNEQLGKIVKNIDDTYEEVRTISHNLSPIKISSGSFSTLLRDYIQNFNLSCDFEIALNIFAQGKLNQIRDEIKIEIYRIIQEVLNNISKHAKANKVEVQLIINNNNLNLIIEDDGIGFKTSHDKSNGIGLKNIESRIKFLGGFIDIDSSIGRGTIVNIDIPNNNSF